MMRIIKQVTEITYTFSQQEVVEALCEKFEIVLPPEIAIGRSVTVDLPLSCSIVIKYIKEPVKE